MEVSIMISIIQSIFSLIKLIFNSNKLKIAIIPGGFDSRDKKLFKLSNETSLDLSPGKVTFGANISTNKTKSDISLKNVSLKHSNCFSDFFQNIGIDTRILELSEKKLIGYPYTIKNSSVNLSFEYTYQPIEHKWEKPIAGKTPEYVKELNKKLSNVKNYKVILTFEYIVDGKVRIINIKKLLDLEYMKGHFDKRWREKGWIREIE